MHARFHAPDAREPGQLVTLTADEATHLATVMRLKAGASVRIFDGSGNEFEAVVERVAKNGVDVRLSAARTAQPEPRIRVTLAQAVLKGDKMDDVIRDAVMIGASAVTPVLAARSESSMLALERGRRHERWQRIAVVSAKQCGRAVVPPVHRPCTFEAALAATAGESAHTLMFVEPGAGGANVRSLHDLKPTASLTLLVGPEGGWSAEELSQAASSATLVRLQMPTVRADAMPVVAIAALLGSWGEI